MLHCARKRKNEKNLGYAGHQNKYHRIPWTTKKVPQQKTKTTRNTKITTTNDNQKLDFHSDFGLHQKKKNRREPRRVSKGSHKGVLGEPRRVQESAKIVSGESPGAERGSWGPWEVLEKSCEEFRGVHKFRRFPGPP